MLPPSRAPRGRCPFREPSQMKTVPRIRVRERRGGVSPLHERSRAVRTVGVLGAG